MMVSRFSNFSAAAAAAIRRAVAGILAASLAAMCGCPSNNPYPEKEADANYYYASFSQMPKHLDPARSYSEDEYQLIGLVYEPPFQYHYLKRPFELIPLTATGIPEPKFFDKDDRPLPNNAADDAVAKVEYTIHIKPGIMYQNHPCFAKDAKGDCLYRNLTDDDLSDIDGIPDFKQTGTRELVAADYVHQVRRFGDPRLECPIAQAVLDEYILGMSEYREAVREGLKAVRAKRSEAAGATYNQMEDELRDPIALDLYQFPLPGATVVDRYTYKICLNKKYPLILLWMTLPFFAPMPHEAEEFYRQPVLKRRNFDLNHWPVGTGPYQFEVYRTLRKIVLARNTNFDHETYPSEGGPGDREAGLLADAGKPLPFIDKVVFSYENDSIPRWLKFMQGYYESSYVPAESFDKAIQFNEGRMDLSDTLTAHGVRLSTALMPSITYYGFNMRDPVVGGPDALSEKKCKLRQAISIALDEEEFIQIFENDRGVPAMGPLAPDIPGYFPPDRPEGVNRYVYDIDPRTGRAKRKSIEEAKRLLGEAGYAGGALVIHIDGSFDKPEKIAEGNWLTKQFAKLDIHLDIRSSDYSTFQEKMSKGTSQFFHWGWNADYPDPDNFLFLLYSQNRMVGQGGDNATNYENPRYDKLFVKMKAMESSNPERAKIIAEMVDMVQHDAPWVWGYHPESFGLRHQWVMNSKPMPFGNNHLKYIRLDPHLRRRLRAEWNQPVTWPVWAAAGAFAVIVAPMLIIARRRQRESI
jgi:oligopeptide transport system substrate-binding protein